MIANLMASLEVGGIGAMAIATVSRGSDDVSCGSAVSPATQGAIRGRGVALQTVGGGAVAVGILQDIATMAGLTAAGAGKEGVQTLLVAGAEIGVIGGMADDTGTALSTVNALVWRLQGTCTLRVDMAGAAAVAALVVDGGDVIGIGSDVALVVAGDALGASSDLAECDMVNIAMAGLVVSVAGDTGSVCGAGTPAVGNGVGNRGLRGEALGVGLRRGIVAMAEVAGVAGNPAMEGVDVSLRGQGAIAFLSKVCGVAAVAVGAGGASAKGDESMIVYRCTVVACRAMTQGAAAPASMACGTADQTEVGGTVAEVAVILMNVGNCIQGVGWVMAGGADRGGSHIAACLVVLLEILWMVGWPIASVASLTINLVIGLA